MAEVLVYNATNQQVAFNLNGMQAGELPANQGSGLQPRAVPISPSGNQEGGEFASQTQVTVESGDAFLNYQVRADPGQPGLALFIFSQHLVLGWENGEEMLSPVSGPGPELYAAARRAQAE